MGLLMEKQPRRTPPDQRSSTELGNSSPRGCETEGFRVVKTLTFDLFLGTMILLVLGVLMGAVVSEKGVQEQGILWLLPDTRQTPVI